MTTNFVIIGGGGFGREVACYAVDAANKGATRVRGFVDDAVELAHDHGFPPGVPYLGSIDGFKIQVGDQVLVAIADGATRRRVVERLRARGCHFGTLLHASAVVSVTAQIGEGVILCPFTLVSSGARVDSFVIVNAHSSIGHDVNVGAYVTLSAYVDLTGGVQVGEETLLGSGARALPGVKIGTGAVIGAGAVIVRSVPPGVTMYAAPAKRLS